MTKTAIWLLAALAGTAAASSAGAWPGCEEDRFSTSVAGDTLTVYHDKTLYNCCMDGVDYSVVQNASVIQIQETEILTIPCTCVCCYDLAVQVADLAAGLYTVVFTWYDYDTDQWEQWTDQVTIGGGGGQPHVVASSSSGCLDPAVGFQPQVEFGSWGRVKARYQ